MSILNNEDAHKQCSLASVTQRRFRQQPCQR